MLHSGSGEHVSKDGDQILRRLVQTAGIFFLVNVLAFAVDFIFVHWPPSYIAQMIGLGIFLFMAVLLAYWLVHRPRSSIDFLTAKSSSDENDGARLADFVAVRLLGLYLLIQALGEVVHIIVYKTAFAYQLAITLGAGARAWIETTPTHSVSPPAALFQALAGMWLLLGTRRVAEFIRWCRSAGRDWDDDADAGAPNTNSPDDPSHR